MVYGVADLLALLRTPVGRTKILIGAYYRAWPLLRPIAAAHRRTFARRPRVVAVVGSFGKTTAARAVTTALGRPPHRRIRFNSTSFLAEAVLRVRPWHRHAVLEVGINGPGQMTGYAHLVRPDIVVVTSIGSEHNRSLGTLEVTRHEKAEMVRALPSDGLAVLNGDDPHVRWMAGQTRARVVTCGLGEDDEVRASEVRLDWPHGTRFMLHAGGETRAVRVRLLGRAQIYAILAAVAVGLAEGCTLDQLIPRLEALEPTPGRLEVVPLANGAILLRDDFKAPFETVEVALDVLAEIPAQRRLVVLGDLDELPGSRGPIYRQLGERIGRIAGRAVLVLGSHSFRRYAVGIRRAGLPPQALVHVDRNVSGAIRELRAELQPGDVVLLKGRAVQRIGRVAIALAGRQVRCDLVSCNLNWLDCDDCPMLERGWDNLRAVT